MAEYKLTYFDSRGYAELARLMFAMAEVPFEDIRMPFTIGQPSIVPNEIKQKLPYGQLPVLEFGDMILSQSLTIGRFLARKFKFYGDNDVEMALIDEITDAAKDFADGCRPMFTGDTEQAKSEGREKTKKTLIPRYMGKFNEILEHNPSGFLVGNSISLADFAVFNFIGYIGPYSGIDLTNDYPALQVWERKIKNIPQIQSWIERRPKTLF